jgi:hypothetical protein
VRIVDATGAVLQQLPDQAAGLPIEDLLLSWFSGNAAVYCCNTFFNTRKLREIGCFNSRHFCYPDTMATFRLAAQHPRIDLREVKASFRIHGNKVGESRKIREWCEDSLDLLQLMCDLAPRRKEEIRKAGTRFLARANYGRATRAASPAARLLALMKVMRYFRYRELPSLKTIARIFAGTPLYTGARIIKRSVSGQARASAAS